MKQIGVILPGGKIKLHRTKSERELGKVTQEVLGVLAGPPPYPFGGVSNQKAPEPPSTPSPEPVEDDRGE